MRIKKMMIAALLLVAVANGPSHFAYAENTHQLDDYSGQVGSAPIAMTLVFSGDKIAERAHYYYRKYLQDIPLTGTKGRELRLTEPGGGLFVLHYIDSNNKVVTAEQSIGLAGTWSSNNQVEPVKLFAEGSGIYVVGHRYAEITHKTDDQFEVPIKGFYNAVLARKPAVATQFVSFPLRVNTTAGKYIMVHNSDELKQKWDHIFSPQWLKALAASSPHDLPVIQKMAMIGAGLAFFNEKGLAVVNTTP
ncbi:hypothetical protein [Acetobacter sp. AAB5]|uniref:hypothetical protein n=1 Tax=Acetobacter sp. AAB5 TaxID=3418370 RepID=UPI003CF654B9